MAEIALQLAQLWSHMDQVKSNAESSHEAYELGRTEISYFFNLTSVMCCQFLFKFIIISSSMSAIESFELKLSATSSTVWSRKESKISRLRPKRACWEQVFLQGNS